MEGPLLTNVGDLPRPTHHLAEAIARGEGSHGRLHVLGSLAPLDGPFVEVDVNRWSQHTAHLSGLPQTCFRVLLPKPYVTLSRHTAFYFESYPSGFGTMLFEMTGPTQGNQIVQFMFTSSISVDNVMDICIPGCSTSLAASPIPFLCQLGIEEPFLSVRADNSSPDWLLERSVYLDTSADGASARYGLGIVRLCKCWMGMSDIL